MVTAPERVVDLVRDGKKIEAVAVVREETGACLTDALRAVEAMVDQGHAADPMPEVCALAREGRAVEAIRLLRERSGLGLKEAKDVVDALPRPEAATPSRVLLVVAVVAALALIVAALVLLAA